MIGFTILLAAATFSASDRCTFDFFAISREKVEAEELAATNLLANPLGWAGDVPYIWTPKEGADKMVRNDRVKAMLTSGREGDAWWIRTPDTVGGVLDEGERPDWLHNFAKMDVQLATTNGGPYGISLSYNASHVHGSAAWGAYCQIYAAPTDGKLALAKNFRLEDTWTELGGWHRRVLSFDVPPGSAKLMVRFRFDGTGHLAFRSVKLYARPRLKPEPSIRFLVRGASQLDGRFAVEENGVGALVVGWKCAKGVRMKPYETEFVWSVPKGFAFVGANLADAEHPPVVERQADGSTCVVCTMTKDFQSRDNCFPAPWDLSILVRHEGVVGTEGVLTVSARRKGEAVGETGEVTLFTIPKVTYPQPKRALPGMMFDGSQYFYRNDIGANYTFGKFLREKGVRWVIPTLDVVREEGELIPMWRQYGVKFITPYQNNYLANGYLVGRGDRRPADRRLPTEDKFVAPSNIARNVWQTLATCPAAVYEVRPSFARDTMGELSEWGRGLDGMWCNWEPQIFKGCHCAACRKRMAAWCAKTGDSEEHFHSMQHGKLVRTLARHFTDGFGTGEAGLLPAISYMEAGSYGRLNDHPSRNLLKDYATSLKWLPVWGPYRGWNQDHEGQDNTESLNYVGKRGMVVASWVWSKDIREEMDRLYGEKCPKLMGQPTGTLWTIQPEWLEISMDAFFFNRFEAVVPWIFPYGADARYWQAFGRAAARMAHYEDAVYEGVRNDAVTLLTSKKGFEAVCSYPDRQPLPNVKDVPLLQQATYDRQGVRIVACLNFDDQRHAEFTLRTKGLSGRYRVVREDGVILFGGRTFTGEELATTGVELTLNASTTRVFEFRPASILVYNEDNTQDIFDASAEKYAALVDKVCRGAVTHFFMCPNAQLSNVASDFLEPTWTSRGTSGRSRRDFPAITKELHEKVIDPYAIWAKRARERGVSPWLTVRMNDIHCVTDTNYWGHSRFWLEHPEFRRDPKAHGSRWEDYALDYSHRAVRDRMLGYIGELAARYDVDGIECDWMRFPYHLTKGRMREQAQILTDFMAEARKVIAAAADKRGRRILLGARVTSSYDGALELGTNPIAWAKDASIDWLVVGNFFGTVDFNLDYADWAKRIGAVNPNVTVVPSLDSGVCKEYWAGRRYLTLEELRGWCDTQYAQGASGFYVFNPFHFEENGLNEQWNGLLDGGLAPGAVKASSRAYPVSFRECLSRKLPRTLTDLQVDQSADGLAVRLRIGEAPDTGTAAVLLAFDRTENMIGRLQGTCLNGVVPTAVVETDRNWLPGKTLAKGSFRLDFQVSSLKPGVNVLQLPTLKSTTLVACELRIELP